MRKGMHMASQKTNSKVEMLYGKKMKEKKDTKAKDMTEEDRSLLRMARERKTDGETYWKENWEASEDDLTFLSGEQWDSQIRTERELEQRPCLTNNVLPTFVKQVTGDQRQNRPTIKVSATQANVIQDVENWRTYYIKNLKHFRQR